MGDKVPKNTYQTETGNVSVTRDGITMPTCGLHTVSK